MVQPQVPSSGSSNGGDALTTSEPPRSEPPAQSNGSRLLLPPKPVPGGRALQGLRAGHQLLDQIMSEVSQAKKEASLIRPGANTSVQTRAPGSPTPLDMSPTKGATAPPCTFSTPTTPPPPGHPTPAPPPRAAQDGHVSKTGGPAVATCAPTHPPRVHDGPTTTGPPRGSAPPAPVNGGLSAGASLSWLSPRHACYTVPSACSTVRQTRRHAGVTTPAPPKAKHNEGMMLQGLHVTCRFVALSAS